MLSVYVGVEIVVFAHMAIYYFTLNGLLKKIK